MFELSFNSKSMFCIEVKENIPACIFLDEYLEDYKPEKVGLFIQVDIEYGYALIEFWKEAGIFKFMDGLNKAWIENSRKIIKKSF
jgi:hypothetical protein